jgi:hypothetical protein
LLGGEIKKNQLKNKNKKQIMPTCQTCDLNHKIEIILLKAIWKKNYDAQLKKIFNKKMI